MEAIEAHGGVKCLQHAVKVADDVESAVPHVAGIETHAELVGVGELGFHGVDDRAEFLKSAADLGSLAGHCFQEDRGRGRFRETGEDAHEHGRDVQAGRHQQRHCKNSL